MTEKELEAFGIHALALIDAAEQIAELLEGDWRQFLASLLVEARSQLFQMSPDELQVELGKLTAILDEVETTLDEQSND